MKRSEQQRPAAQAIGRHLLADLEGIDAGLLRDEALLSELLESSLWAAGFTVLGKNFHKFTSGGCGVTGVALLSESHAALHTYPEYGYLALDVFSCGHQAPEGVLRRFVDALKPDSHSSEVYDRG